MTATSGATVPMIYSPLFLLLLFYFPHRLRTRLVHLCLQALSADECPANRKIFLKTRSAMVWCLVQGGKKTMMQGV
ncbi:hypothetical protein BC939DRAFT_456512 [Gamsiella multidivaricata]|uniref:uncharacterized protein n=1 Tax=Gamsiella multidivaricata TaxID=101098 RepID=UPI002220FC05|nr:uncharacterized protein BC939DRAFT_456512 [Gamsiella multidivaricata]KAI7821094.1 hypothetical protein BC939DRAFT_456512 [Gamsiella multidivaricata]